MEGLNLFESNILLWIQENLRTDALDFLMPYVSAVNNAGLLSMLTVILLIVLAKYRKVGITAFFSLATEAVIVNLFLKNCTARVRPYVVNEALLLLGHMPGDFSFPSGHTGAAFAVATVLFLYGKDDIIPKKYAALAVAAAVLVAVSRLYNAAHYPSDVLIGMLIGMFTGVLACKVISVYGFKKNQDFCPDSNKLGD